MSSLQISLQLDVTGDQRPEVNVTPIDIPLPEGVSKELEKALQAADAFDPHPGDGQFDSVFKAKIPVHLWILNTSVTVNGDCVVKIKHA